MKEPAELAEELAQATALSAASRWGEAAEAWGRVHGRAMRSGDLELAQRGASERVEALRRDDRPAQMLDALGAALALVEGDARTPLEVQVVAAMADIGQLRGAARRASELLARTTRPGTRLVVADTLAGVLLSRGDLLGLSNLVEQLEAEARGPARLSARFRRAQLERMQGQLDAAAQGFIEVHETLAPHPAAAAAAGGALAELADICLIKGEFDECFAFLGGAAQHFQQARRRAALFQLEAERALAVLTSGANFLPGLLDDHVEYAGSRGLVLLEARARLARGLCRVAGGSEAAWSDLDAAVLLADTAGAPLLAGRARLERFHAGLGEEGGVASTEDLRRAVEDLTGDRVWHSRAMVVLAEALMSRRPAEAIELVGRAMCRFQAMDLGEDEAACKRVLATAGRKS